MIKFLKNKLVIAVIALVILALLILGIYEAVLTDRAHKTFENYYAFRGCTQLLEKTDTYGICKTSSGDTIKIVLYRGQWYLDGDLPICWRNFCF